MRTGTAGLSGAVAEQDRMAGGKRKRVKTPPEVGDRVSVRYDKWEEGKVTRVEGGDFWVAFPHAVPVVNEEGWSGHWRVLTRQKWGHFPSPSKQEEEGVK